MTDPGLKDKVALVSGGNNPFGIGAAIARALASYGAKVFIHYFLQATVLSNEDQKSQDLQNPGLEFFFKQQTKTADEVLTSIRDAGGNAESWEGDLREPENVNRLFEQAEKTFGQVDILVNNATEYIADNFLPLSILGEKTEVWEKGPATSTID